MTPRPVALPLASLLLAAGCTRDQAAPISGSGGSDAPVWTAATAWTISTAPVVRMGKGDTGSELFDGVRIIQHLDDHRIGVVDGTVAGIRVFDPTGDLAYVMGREGEGPGEFRRINALLVRGDTIYVADARLGRLTWYDLDGRYVGQLRLPEELAGRTQVAGVFGNGDFLLEEPPRGSRVVQTGGLLPPDSIRWYRASRSFEGVRLLTAAVGLEVYGHPWQGGFALGEVMFGARASAVPWGDTLLVARGEERFEVDLIGADGTTSASMGRDLSPRRPDETDRERYTEWRLANAPGTVTEAWRRVFEEAPMREFLPATAAVLVDSWEDAWVQYYTQPWDQERWAVFDASHRWLGDLEVPADSKLMDVWADRAVVVHQDSLGVETVEIHEIRKPGAAG